MIETQPETGPKLVDSIVTGNPKVHRLAELADQLPAGLEVKFSFVTHSLFEEDPESREFVIYREQNNIGKDKLHQLMEVVYKHEELYNQFQESQQLNLTWYIYLQLKAEVIRLKQERKSNKEIAYITGRGPKTIQKISDILTENGVIQTNSKRATSVDDTIFTLPLSA